MTTYSEQQDTERVEQPYGFEPPVAANEYPAEELQRQRYGGANWGAGFFGWLVVLAMTLLLAAAAAATAVALGLEPPSGDTAVGSTPLLTAAAVALLVVWVAWFSGGYVAGRMSRFDGGRQGLAVWVVGLLLTGGVAGLALVLGPQVDVPDRLDLPAAGLTGVPTGLTALAGAAIVLVVGLLAAVVGGKVGCRYHRKVDDAAYV
jgi:hypothetical protein